MYSLVLSPCDTKRAAPRPGSRKLLFEIGAGLLAAWAFSTVADYVSYLWDAEAWLTNRLFEIGQEIQEAQGVSQYDVEKLMAEKAELEAQLAEVRRARAEAESQA